MRNRSPVVNDEVQDSRDSSVYCNGENACEKRNKLVWKIRLVLLVVMSFLIIYLCLLLRNQRAKHDMIKSIDIEYVFFVFSVVLLLSGGLIVLR